MNRSAGRQAASCDQQPSALSRTASEPQNVEQGTPNRRSSGGAALGVLRFLLLPVAIRRETLSTPAPPALARFVCAVFAVALIFYVLAAPTLHAYLHRYASGSLLFTTGQLLALWVMASLVGLPLRYARSWANVCLWLLLGLLLLHVLPLPRVGVVGQDPGQFGPLRARLVDHGVMASGAVPHRPGIGRFGLLPGPAVGVLIAAAQAAGLYWLVGSAVVGRKALRWTTWAAVLGLVPLAAWGLIGTANSEFRVPSSEFRSGPGLVPVLGGDSLVPAMLAALPLGCALVLRPLGGMPRLPPDRRQSRWGWLGRRGVVWAAIGGLVVGLMAAALGASHVPPVLGFACLAIAAGVPLLGAKKPQAAFRVPRSALRVPTAAVALAAWLVLAWLTGAALAGPRVAAAEAAAQPLRGLWRTRDWLGFGAGCISPSAAFGLPGWPRTPGLDGDTSGYAVLAAEIGLVGAALAVAFGAFTAGRCLRAWRRARAPGVRLALLAGLGAVLANAFYFAFDASAILVPNLMAIATVLGLTVAWDVHRTAWHRAVRRRLGQAHWPFVVGAVGMAAALGMAESSMLGAGRTGLNDKLLHFGTFAVISLLVCHALGPQPQAAGRWLKAHIALAVLAAAALGVGIELAQVGLTAGRSFEGWDIGADVLGACAVGFFWWVLRRGQEAWAAQAAAG